MRRKARLVHLLVVDRGVRLRELVYRDGGASFYIARRNDIQKAKYESAILRISQSQCDALRKRIRLFGRRTVVQGGRVAFPNFVMVLAYMARG